MDVPLDRPARMDRLWPALAIGLSAPLVLVIAGGAARWCVSAEAIRTQAAWARLGDATILTNAARALDRADAGSGVREAEESLRAAIGALGGHDPGAAAVLADRLAARSDAARRVLDRTEGAEGDGADGIARLLGSLDVTTEAALDAALRGGQPEVFAARLADAPIPDGVRQALAARFAAWRRAMMPAAADQRRWSNAARDLDAAADTARRTAWTAAARQDEAWHETALWASRLLAAAFGVAASLGLRGMMLARRAIRLADQDMMHALAAEIEALTELTRETTATIEQQTAGLRNIGEAA